MGLFELIVLLQKVLENLGPSIVALLRKQRDQFGGKRFGINVQVCISKKSEVFLAPEA